MRLIDHDRGALSQLIGTGDELTGLPGRSHGRDGGMDARHAAGGFALADIIRLGALQGKLYIDTAVACSYGTPVRKALEGGVTRNNFDGHCTSRAADPPCGAAYAPRP